jgi:hypothetical protein
MMQTNIMPAPGAATVLCRQESAPNYDRVVVVLNDRWRLIECRDGIQWILQEREGAADTPATRFRSRRYHRTRDTLFVAMGRIGIFPTADHAAAIAALPSICGRA